MKSKLPTAHSRKSLPAGIIFRSLILFLVLILGACDSTTPLDDTDTEGESPDTVEVPLGPVTVTTTVTIRPFQRQNDEIIYGDSVVVEAAGTVVPISLDSAWTTKVTGDAWAYSLQRESGDFFAFFIETCGQSAHAFVVLASDWSEPYQNHPNEYFAQKHAQPDEVCNLYVFAIRGFGNPLSQLPDTIYSLGRNESVFKIPIANHVVTGIPVFTRDSFSPLRNPGDILYSYTFHTTLEATGRNIVPLHLYRDDYPYPSWGVCLGTCTISLGHRPYGKGDYLEAPPYEDRMRYFIFLIDLTTREK